MACYFPADAHTFVTVGSSWLAELQSVLPPNHNRKCLVWVRQIEVQESGQTWGLLSKMNTRNASANGGGLADVVFVPQSDAQFALAPQDTSPRKI